MSDIKNVFYDLFWQSKACQNMFLLSKEELLDNIEIDILDIQKRISLPRIIISNIENKENEDFETIKHRTDSIDIITSRNLDLKVNFYEPLITNFLDSKFGKSFTRLVSDFNKNNEAFFEKIVSVIFSDNPEMDILELLQDYGFIGKHIKSSSEMMDYFEREGVKKIITENLTEDNFRSLLEFAKGLKDIYSNHLFRSLYESNQVLVSSLHSQDDFKSRLELFNELYEAKVLFSSKEDAFIQCTKCKPGTYRGVFQLMVNPRKLSGFKCPVCNSSLKYYVPYELHPEIYAQVKRKDGILQCALEDLLERNDLEFGHGKKYLNNIEIDCEFEFDDKLFIVECKMYVSKIGLKKLKEKLKSHFFKLQKDVKRLMDHNIIGGEVYPILLVNVSDETFLDEVMQELRAHNPDMISHSIRIMNIQSFKALIKK